MRQKIYGKAKYWHCTECGLLVYDNGDKEQRCLRCGAKKGKVRPLTARERAEILERDGHRCSWPDCSETEHLEVHHIHWRHFGGKNDGSNLITLCHGHHQQMHPGLAEARASARAGNGNAYNEYAKTIRQMTKQPFLKMAYVLYGIAIERERMTE